MLAKETEHPFSDEGWVYEIKWDGYRAIAECGKKETQFYSRNGISFADKYPLIYEQLQAIKTPMVLDGEVVVLDEKGQPSFQKLQHYEENKHLPLLYYVFDILNYKGKDCMHQPLIERKALLQQVLPANDIIRYCDHIETEGIAFFEQVRQRDMEGIIAKKKDSTYQPGKRTGAWLKIKNQHTEEMVIAGFTAPQGGRKYFGALVLGKYVNGQLTYTGHTGTGFNDQLLKELYNQLLPYETATSPFENKVKVNNKVTWIQPKFVANIRYTEITKEGIMRHPVFQGLRIDKTVDDMKKTDNSTASSAKKSPKKTAAKKSVKEAVKKTIAEKEPEVDADAEKDDKKGDDKEGNKQMTVDNIQLQLTHLSKIYWPDEGITKGDLIDYYNQVYPFIIPYLRNRPQSLKRNPGGINDAGFFQKNVLETAPDWAETIKLHSDAAERDIYYFLCNNKASLLYMANLGCIEVNPWNSSVKSLDYPDYLIIDLDPADNQGFNHVIDVALMVKQVLESIGATGYCKTSGASGMHIYVPMGAKYTYDQCKNFAELLAHLVVEQAPDITTTERPLNKRNGKMYVDFLQNRKGQTLASVYSARPKPGAPVSMPLLWDEVKQGLHPSDFTIKNALKRIEQKGDIFKPVLGKGINMEKCLKKMS